MPLEESARLSKEAQQEIVAEAKQRLDFADSFEDEFRQQFVEDLRFVYEDEGQWEQRILAERSDRPCYTFNRTEGAIDQVVGDQRQSRPSIRIRAVEGSDKELADTLSGLARNILNVSDMETIQDHAFTYACAGGYGVWRIVHEFNSDDAFEQDIVIKEIANPLTAYGDPAATDICKRDGRFWVITEKMPLDDFEAEYPDADKSDFSSDDSVQMDWYGEDEVRIAEYYRKVDKKRQLLQLSDGRVVYEDQISDIIDELAEAGITIEKRRTVKSTVVEWYKLCGNCVLEGPIEYPWKYIPVVPVYGKRLNIEGEYLIKGITRNAKDPQRSYNYIRSVMTEKALLSPKFGYMLTPRQIKGYQSWWDQAHTSALPYILYNPDPETPEGRPQPAMPNPVPIELVQIAQMDAEDIKTATGKFDASLGAQGNEVSGTAIRQRQIEGDVSSFVYLDNLAKAIKFTGEILVDMIPRIYDTERVIRVLGEDGAEDFVTLNQTVTDEETGSKVIVNDLSKGKYDVVVSIGPSYSTQRQEAAERMGELGRAFPGFLEISADVIAKNLDIPGSEEIEKRFRKLLLQRGIVEPTDEEREELEQNQPQQPDPLQQLALREAVRRVEKLEAEIEKIQAEAQNKRAEAGETAVDTIDKAAEIGIDPQGNVAKLDRLIPPTG